MNKHLKFRRLLAESLEQRQLFATDIFDDGSELDCSGDNSSTNDSASLIVQSSAYQSASYQFRPHFGAEFHFRRSNRLSGEGEFGSLQIPHQDLNSFGLQRDYAVRSSDNSFQQSNGRGLESGSQGDGSSTNRADNLAFSNGGQVANASRPTSPTSPSSANPVGTINSVSSSRSDGSSNAANSASSTNSANSVPARNSGISSAVVIIINLTEPSVAVVNSGSNLLPFLGSRAGRTSDVLNSAPNSDRNPGSSTVQSIQQQHANNLSSIQSFVTSDIAKVSRDNSTTVALNSELRSQAGRTNVSSGETVQQQNRGLSLEQDKSGQPAVEHSLVDSIENLTMNQLSSLDRPWKLTDQAIKNLRSLSNDSETSANQDSNANDVVIAAWFDEGGFSEIDFRKVPISRPQQPWAVAQAVSRLESKVGTYRVFDVIKDGELNQQSLSAQRSSNVDPAAVVQAGIMANDAISPVLRIEADAVTNELSWMPKPLFLTTLLAVFSGRLLHSRLKRRNSLQQAGVAAKQS